MRDGMKMALGIVAAIILMMGIALASGGWRYITAEFFGKVDQQVQLESAENRTIQYERFFSLCSAAKSFQQTVGIQEQRLENTEDSKVRDRIYSNVAGLKSQLAKTVNEYNTMSGTHTRGRFKAANLPYQLNTGAPITCVN